MRYWVSAAAPVRATQDVDAVVAIASLRDYRRLGKVLRDRGFAQTLAEGEPPYRWTLGSMTLDLMPTSEAVVGFSNRWYEPALRTAVAHELRPGLTVRLVTAACFLATKLEAFEDRGRGDYMASHDLEDVLAVVDGRAGIVDEVAQAEPDLRRYIASVFSRLLADEGFLNALPGLIIDGSPAARVVVIAERLKAICDMKDAPITGNGPPA